MRDRPTEARDSFALWSKHSPPRDLWGLLPHGNLFKAALEDAAACLGMRARVNTKNFSVEFYDGEDVFFRIEIKEEDRQPTSMYVFPTPKFLPQMLQNLDETFTSDRFTVQINNTSVTPCFWMGRLPS